MSLPGADELFRRTSPAEHAGADESTPGPSDNGAPTRPARATDAAERTESGRLQRAPSGRVKHDEKITVYVTADELLDIEQARLALRRVLGGAVDRGRLVRAAVAMALADLDENGADSELARRLGGS